MFEEIKQIKENLDLSKRNSELRVEKHERSYCGIENTTNKLAGHIREMERICKTNPELEDCNELITQMNLACLELEQLRSSQMDLFQDSINNVERMFAEHTMTLNMSLTSILKFVSSQQVEAGDESIESND